MVLVNYDFSDPFWLGRTGYYGITAMPAVAGDGLALVDAWTGLETNYLDRSAIESPLSITLSENGEGDFSAHVVAAESVTDASLYMVAVMDDYVPGATSTVSHLAYHAVAFVTSIDGEPFSISAGESTDVRRTFSVDPSWDYEQMGVACWVQGPGGVNGGPANDLAIANEVLQAAFVPTGSTGASTGGASVLALLPPTPNPSTGESRLSFVLESPGRVAIVIHDVAGRRVATLDRGTLSAGPHDVLWNGRTSAGQDCAAGVYFVRLVLDGETIAGRKLAILR